MSRVTPSLSLLKELVMSRKNHKRPNKPNEWLREWNYKVVMDIYKITLGWGRDIKEVNHRKDLIGIGWPSAHRSLYKLK